MNLLDDTWQTFDGEPVAGRIPAKVIVQGDAALSVAQIDGVKAAYRTFTRAQQASLARHSVQHVVLGDGSRVRIERNGDAADRVFVTPPPPTGQVGLEDIFVGVAGELSWAGPLGYDERGRYSIKAKIGATGTPTPRPSRLIADNAGIRQHPGILDWYSDSIVMNAKPIVVSWYADRGTRYGRLPYMGRIRQTVCDFGLSSALYGSSAPAAGSGTWDQTTWFDCFKAAVWINGIRYNVKDADGNPIKVLSAALRRTGGSLKLCVISSDVSLAVYSGSVNLTTTGGTVTVAKSFDVGFTVDTTSVYFTPSGADMDQQPTWQALLQPIYFNASATQAAGLVLDSAVRLIQIDIDAQTTTLTDSHFENTARTTKNVNGMLPSAMSFTDFLNSNGGSISGATKSFDYFAQNKRYGAIDWDGDTLLICMVEVTRIRSEAIEADYSSDIGAANLSFSYDYTAHCQSKYRVYLHGGADLAQKDSGLQLCDTFHFDNSITGRTGGVSGTGATTAASRTEDVTAPFYVDLSVEGGDLRRGLIVTAECVEEGTSAFIGSFTPAYATDGSGNPASWEDGDGWLWFNHTLTGTTSSTQTRSLHGVLRAWHAGVEVASASPETLSHFSTGQPSQWTVRSISFWTGVARSQVPVEESGFWEINVTDEVIDGTPDSAELWYSAGPRIGKLIRNTASPSTSGGWARFSHHSLYSMGAQMINACAFNHDASIAYLALGAFVAPYQMGIGSTGYDAHKAWLYQGGSWAEVFAYPGFSDPPGSVDVDGLVTLADPPWLSFVAPLFLTNVPTGA